VVIRQQNTAVHGEIAVGVGDPQDSTATVAFAFVEAAIRRPGPSREHRRRLLRRLGPARGTRPCPRPGRRRPRPPGASHGPKEDPMNSEQGDERPRIVVGVDGFEPSTAALRWAIHQAKLTGAVVEAVTAWHIPAGTGLVPPADMPDYQDDARAVLCEAITEMAAVDPDVQVCPRVVEGRAGQVLVGAAEGATCWWSAAGATADSLRRCWDRSASSACITRRARSSSCAASTKAEPESTTQLGAA
jgi:Universal stress protein family